MEDAGFNGTMASDDLCPIALWLGARINAEIHMGSGRVSARRGPRWTETIMPPAVADFVGRFDAGRYSQLGSPFRPSAGLED